jgi:diaminohydroxyphosphoribosylaminopyrimidine deaminase/5-amino-6-(5-phosphoribosylamino)uracil reductase
MRRALTLAAKGRGTTSPNPHVGAVIVRGGEVVGAGFHRRAGEAHAETQALAEAGAGSRGATLYVNLEPCAHQGRTPPCADAVVAAGLRRVVIGHLDPDPRTAGSGMARLTAAGIQVQVGVEAERALELNSWFVVQRLSSRPSVTLKWAASLDGKIATRRRQSRWITGERARRDALRLREEHDAILVGIETALADDPRLDRRLGVAAGPIVRVVLDRRLRLSPTARLFEVPGPVVIFTEGAPGAPTEALRARGAEVIRLRSVTPKAVLERLARRGVQSVLVEGGGVVAEAFVRADLVDRLVGFVAPLLIGGQEAPTCLSGRGAAALVDATRLEIRSVRRLGADLRVDALRDGFLAEARSRLVESAGSR